MRASLSHLAWTVAAALLMLPRPLEAQMPDLPGLDISGTVGWFANDRELPEAQFFDDVQHRWIFGADVGYYWTEHVKTEFGLSATTTGSSYVLVPLATSSPDRTYPYASGHSRVREVRAVAQQIYQFGHNAWVHPFVGAGLVVLRETSRLELGQPPFVVQGRPATSPEGAETATRVKPVVSAGLKAYISISPRAFVRADILISPWTTSRDVTMRAGIGVDLK